MWRGEQYNLAMFPLNIKAVISVLGGKKLAFVVTPKHRDSGRDFRLIWPQATVIALSIAAAIYGLVMFFFGRGLNVIGLVVNLFWSAYNVLSLGIVVKALYYQLPKDWSAEPPEFLSKGDITH